MQSNFIEITLGHKCSPVNLLYIFRTLFPKSTSAGLLLKEHSLQYTSLKHRVTIVFFVTNVVNLYELQMVIFKDFHGLNQI